MTSLGIKTVTGLYIGISALAFYFLMHAALIGQSLLTTTTLTKTPTSVAFQQAPSSEGNNSSTTGSSGTTGSSTTTQPGSDSGSATSGSNLASQQYGDTTNWAGYAATGKSYTTIAASWDTPTASGTGEASADATWIGIGGIEGSDLIQVGTQDIVDPSGDVSVSAFYEMLPDASVDIPDVTINPGDTVSASISEVSSGEWRITLTDSTDGQSFSTVVAYNSSELSAEWIQEDPSDGNGQQIPLDDFGTVTFTDGTTTADGDSISISGSGAQEVSMINDADQSLADVSSLSASGESFSVTRTSATSGASIAELNNNPGGWIRRGTGIGFGVYGYDGFGGGSGMTPGVGYGF